ncbi:MAG: DUF4345 domain-containing protein [Bacteroidetes bacterium]|nr:DUF4345 domain-containing protein [Bacteroidota bacterium]
MSIALSILLGLVAAICFLGGANIIIKGAMGFLPKQSPPQFVLDNLFRFLGGIYFASGTLFVYAIINIATLGPFITLLGVIVLFSGLGRLYSRLSLGSAGKYFDYIMIVEFILGVSIMLLEYLR